MKSLIVRWVDANQSRALVLITILYLAAISSLLTISLGDQVLPFAWLMLNHEYHSYRSQSDS